MKFGDLIKSESGRMQASFSTIVKIILIFSIFYSTYYHLWHILFANILLLILMFMPYFMRKSYEIHIPKVFEFLFLIFVLLTFFLGDVRGVIIQVVFGIAMGFIGFTVMLILFSNSKFKTNYLLTIIFSFSLSLTLALIAEMIKYYLKLYLDYTNINADYPHTMLNLSLVAIGTLISSIFGYIYMKGYKVELMKEMVSEFKHKNPNLFVQRSDSPEEIIMLIKKGENEKLEFKSTLRTNLHTGEHDKKIENAALKTIVAFLNSEGGTLLIGVSNEGEILGIEKDNFENNDRFNRHFTNLVKERIGNEFLPYMNFELILIENKNIFKVDCRKSDKPVFLKCDSKEEFYIRVGASSLEIIGSKIIDYIKNKFKNE